MADGRGGARPGSGRKSKADKYSGPIARAEDRIADRLPDLIDRLLELSEGVEVQKTDARGGTKVYSEPPHFKAIEYLINRILGKPTERHEHGGDGDGEDAASILAVLLRALAGHPEARNIAAAALMGPEETTSAPAPDEPDDAATAGDGAGPVADHGEAGV